MNAEDVADLKVIDCDTHVLEPYDLWTSRVSAKKWGDRIPHVRWDEERQMDVWWAGDRCIGRGAVKSANAGWREAPPRHPARFEDVSPDLWRAEDRLRLMDRYGIHAQILYPNVAGVGFGTFTQPIDRDLDLVLIQAYNDFLSDWSEPAPSRLVPVSALPFWDLDLSIAEMQRCYDRGHRGILFSQSPQGYGQPRLADKHWDPLWSAAQEMQIPVNFHIAGGGDTSPMELLPPEAGEVAGFAIGPVSFFIGNCAAISSLIGGGVCHRFPDLNFVSVESGVGWLPFTVEALDWMWKECDVRSEHPEYELLPSEYFKRQIYGCFWFEHGATLDAALSVLGPDNILYETDFPHPTSMSPGPASSAKVPKNFIAEDLGYLPADVLKKIVHDNAAKLYQLD